MNDVWNGDRIRKLRGKKTKTEFGKNFNVTYRTIRNWERSKNAVKDKYINKLNKLAGLPSNGDEQVLISKKELYEICNITILQEAFYIEVCKMINENKKIKEILRDRFQYLKEEDEK